MKLSLAANLDDFFLNALHQSLVLLCTVAINVLEPRAFKTESQYFIPLFNKISWLWTRQPGGDEASNEGCNSGSTGHDFMDNFIALALFHPAFRLSSSVPEKSRFYFWVFSTLLITLLSKTRILIFNCVKETKSRMISSGLFWNHYFEIVSWMQIVGKRKGYINCEKLD
jgi:hypothetical protein